jgi:hypothetical protein
MKTVRRQQSVQVVRAGSCWGAPPQAAAATVNSSTRQVSALLRGGHTPPHPTTSLPLLTAQRACWRGVRRLT